MKYGGESTNEGAFKVDGTDYEFRFHENTNGC
jgi:hypothetical protein